MSSRVRAGQAACDPQSLARCIISTSEEVRPAIFANLDAVSPFCGCMLRAACCRSGSRGVAAVCARSAITRARARGTCRSGPHKCRPRSSEARRRAQPRQAGCGPHVTDFTLQAAEVGLTVLELGRCERCLVCISCILASSHAPSCMQRHAAGLAVSHPGWNSVIDPTACKASLLWCQSRGRHA